MNPLPLLAAGTLLVSAVLAESPADVPAPTAEELASPLPPLVSTEADVQAMKNWTETLRAIADILRTDKVPDAKAAELEQLGERVCQAGEGMKKLRFWKRQPALRKLGLDEAALRRLVAPMTACAEAGYDGSERLEHVMVALAGQLLTGPFSGEQGVEEGLTLTPPQVVQEYPSIVHGVRAALAGGQDDAARAQAMELLTARLFRLGDVAGDSRGFDAIRSEMRRRADDIRAAQQAAGSTIEALGEDISPELDKAMGDFSREMSWLEEHLLP